MLSAGMDNMELNLKIQPITLGGHTEQSGHPGRVSPMSPVLLLWATVFPSILHMTFGNFGCQEQVIFDIVCCLWETNVLFRLPCHCLKYPRQRKSEHDIPAVCRPYVPPTAGKTPRPTDEESAKVWPTRRSHESLWFGILKQTRTA